MNRERLETLYGIDTRSLAVFRIVLAAILLLDLQQRWLWLDEHYTDDGILPLATLYKHYWVSTNWSFHALSPDAGLQHVLFAIQGVATVAFLLGFYTRYANIVVWVLLTSIQTRNQLVLQGGDDLLRMLTFWSMFCPTGARWSLDARHDPSPPARVFSLGSIALMLQICYVYWATAYLKWGAPWWQLGNAVEMTLRLDIYVTWPGKLLLKLTPILPLVTWGTLFWEYAGPLFALSPWKPGPVRTLAVLGFFFLHLAFGVTIEIGLFWMTSCACWLPFLPTWFWDNLPRKFPRLRTARGSGTLRGESPVLDVIMLCALAYITLWNLRTLDGRANYQNMLKVFPTTYNPPGYAFRLDQYWSMFAPGPPTRDGWWVIPAKLDDGTEVDLYGMRTPIDWSRPRHIADTFEGQRWRKFLFNVPDPQHEPLRPEYARYVKQRWERAHPDLPRVREAELVLMVETTLAHGEEAPKRTSLGTYKWP